MLAIIKTGGKQYRVSVGDVLEVERLEGQPGAQVDFREVLLIDDGEKTLLGTPYLDQALVRAEILEEFKDDKVIVFKKKRRKQYKKKRGHRQLQSRVKIIEIIPEAGLKEEVAAAVKPAEVKMEKEEMKPEEGVVLQVPPVEAEEKKEPAAAPRRRLKRTEQAARPKKTKPKELEEPKKGD